MPQIATRKQLPKSAPMHLTEITKTTPASTGQSPIAKATSFLQENSKIGAWRTHHRGYCRMVPLNLQLMYDSLTTIYADVFTVHWRLFKIKMESIQLCTETITPTQSARNYIAHWLCDLYTSNRNVVRTISQAAYSQHYTREFSFTSYVYDEYLIMLNAIIRPTLIEGCPDESMYIPVFGNKPSENHANPFELDNWYYEIVSFRSIIHSMRERKGFVTSTLSSCTTGRASWLLDWYGEDAYAWFPQEGNYSDDDITIAYILGSACTTYLAPRDSDEWQYFPGGTRPNRIINKDYKRLANRVMFGAIEETQINLRLVIPQVFQTSEDAAVSKRKRKIGEETTDITSSTQPATGVIVLYESSAKGRQHEQEVSSPEPQYPEMEVATTKAWQFKIDDFIYNCKVIVSCDRQTRFAALMMLINNHYN